MVLLGGFRAIETYGDKLVLDASGACWRSCPMRTVSSLALLSLALLSGCGLLGGHSPARMRQGDTPWHPPTTILLAYAAADGSLTRAQLIAGLRRDFDKVDKNHDGCLDKDEVRAINEQRWKKDESTASPLIDFKNNGCVDFNEFAATAVSLFDQLDREGIGKLTAAQLKPGSGKAASADQPNSGRRHSHTGGTTPDNPGN